MTVANLFAQHRAGKVSKEKFLYEVRRDAQLPFISNLTSYEDAIKILKQKGMIKEAVMYGGSDGDYDQDQKDKEETELAYDAGYAAFKAGDMEKAEKLYKRARHLGARLSWDETELPPYDQIKESKSPKKLVKEAKFGVYIPNGTKQGTKLDIAVEYKNQPGAKKYFDAEFVSDKDGKYTFNTKEGEIKVPHADLVTYRKSSQKQEGLNESKKIINEQEDLYHQIDRLNPILVKKAVNMELAKLPMIDAGIYQKITEKVVKKLQKDPRAYDEVLVSNAKEIHKVDEKLKMTQVKSELKDPHNQMKSPKGLEKPKTNVKASKTENKKGKPKGVKEMKGSKKGHGGIKQMENPGTKETVLESLLSFMFKKKLNEDTHHEYTEGKKVKTPKGEGVIEGLIGDTATVAYENGVKEDIQINALRHYEEEANKPVEEKTPEVKKHEPTMDEKKDKVIQKVLEFLRKKKMTELTTYIPRQTNKNQIKGQLRKTLSGPAYSDAEDAINKNKSVTV